MGHSEALSWGILEHSNGTQWAQWGTLMPHTLMHSGLHVGGGAAYMCRGTFMCLSGALLCGTVGHSHGAFWGTHDSLWALMGHYAWGTLTGHSHTPHSHALWPKLHLAVGRPTSGPGMAFIWPTIVSSRVSVPLSWGTHGALS